jgi:hypothetical protein
MSRLKKDGFIGDNPGSAISEINYLEWLSAHSGLLNRKFFYNRTVFSDEEFRKKFNEMKSKLNRNFIIAVLLHPFMVLSHWKVYKVYIPYWFRQQISSLKRYLA